MMSWTVNTEGTYQPCFLGDILTVAVKSKSTLVLLTLRQDQSGTSTLVVLDFLRAIQLSGSSLSKRMADTVI